MGVFVVIPTRTDTAAQLDAAIRKWFDKGRSYRLPRGEWLVSHSGTSKELSDVLGITGGDSGSALVLSAFGYYGRASTDIWEWMKQNWESDGNV